MNYIGSKQRLLDFIESSIRSVVPEIKSAQFCDLFAGTATVSQHFNGKVKSLISNDVEEYAHILGAYSLQNCVLSKLDPMIDILNQLPGQKGLFYHHYSLSGSGLRQYFSDENAKKIDAIRIQIEEWTDSGTISEAERIALLAVSIKALDKVANTASVYAAYLKHLKKTAQSSLFIEKEAPKLNDTKTHVYQMDANELIKEISGDILYLDPPYNGRQYGNYYHILNTFVKYDEFEPKGKTGLRPYYRSKYCQKASVKDAFKTLIETADFSHIFLSYNNEGLMSFEDIQNCLSSLGDYHCFETQHPRFTAQKHNPQKTTEYLHCLIKTPTKVPTPH